MYTALERGIDFRARVTLTGESGGRIVFDFDGESFSEFERNRIGICVLHPATAKGAPVTIMHTDNTTESGTLPDTILPHQPFFDISAIRHTAASGLECEIAFSGDTFEMEDQRNWLDASFKTYSTPLALPMPVRIMPGDRVRQSVTLTPHIVAGVAPGMAANVPSASENTDQAFSLGIVLTPEVQASLLASQESGKPSCDSTSFCASEFSERQLAS